VLTSLAADGRPLAGLYPGPVRESIARLQDQELTKMSPHDLVDLILLSGLVATVGEDAHTVPWLSKKDLLKIASLVRRCCRNQLDSYRVANGSRREWGEAI
jgi:hypothetical protein